MKELSRLKGINGVLIVYEECIEISRKSLLAFAYQGGYSGKKSTFTRI